MSNYTTAENITSYLVERKGSCLASVAVKMTKAQQMEILGQYLGKGTLIINGENETVTHIRKVCFGTDSEWTKQIRFDGSVVFSN